MTSPFFGLDIATRALRANQTLVDITNQNVANANTPGYSRQQAVIKETLAYPIPVFRQSGEPGQLGTGVEVTNVTRVRDSFTDYQYRNQIASEGRWTAKQNTLKQIESVVNEPSTSGVSALLNKYWSAWQEVANSPSDVSVRANMLEQGRAVADAFRNTVELFQQQQRDVDVQIRLGTDDVNNYAHQIANLNMQISNVETGGMKANDLRDQRDLLVDKLSEIIKVSTVESSEGSVSVYIGGRQLVDRDRVNELDLDTTGAFARVIWADGSTTSVNITDGKMAGLIESRDTILQQRIDEVNGLARRLIESVNSVHTAGVGLDGVGGLNFFTGTDASTIAVDSTLTANHIAAARPVESPAGSRTYVHAKGDSDNAVVLAQLQTKLAQRDTSLAGGLAPGTALGGNTVLGVDIASSVVNTTFTFAYAAGAPVGSLTINGQAATFAVGTDQPDGSLAPPTRRFITVDGGTLGVRITIAVPATGSQDTDINTALSALNGRSVRSTGPATIGDQYGQEIAAIGVLSSTARGQAANQGVLVGQLERQRQEVSGVSIDEEATHLIQYQHAYQAAARVISVMDSMLDTLINGTGAR